jgi:DNA-directed RNA polymerase subunit RPC12/RpoP
MIRIKCPKCSAPLSLDDDQAGEAAECEECGARFRVPAAKTATAARNGGKGPSSRSRQEDDEDEEDSEEYEDESDSVEEELEVERKKPARASKMSDSTKMNLYLIVGMIVATIVLGIDSIFVRKLGIIVAGACCVGMIYCLLMLSVMAKQDNGPWMAILWLPPIAGCLAAFMIFEGTNTRVAVGFGSLMPLFVIAFGALTWKRTQRLVISYVALYILCGACLGATAVNMGRLEARRVQVRALVDQAQSKK